MTNEYAQQWWAKESPNFTITCQCGIAITGQSEKGVHTLLRKHKEKGPFHLEYEGVTNAST